MNQSSNEPPPKPASQEEDLPDGKVVRFTPRRHPAPERHPDPPQGSDDDPGPTAA
jgi:hypothetical protein